jgi:hypothetical protein
MIGTLEQLTQNIANCRFGLKFEPFTAESNVEFKTTLERLWLISSRRLIKK